MITRKTIKKNSIQIIALTDKNIKLKLRIKFSLIISYIQPIIYILMPIIIMEEFFELKSQLGSWTENNFMLFLIIAYNINLIKGVLTEFPQQLRREKFWKTIPALIIAPFNRYNLLIGIFLSHIILISIPFIILLLICFIIFPISLLTLLFVIFVFFLIALLFSAIGLFLSAFAISNENIWKLLEFGLNLIIWASCITYPFEIFPESIQKIIILNPLYYIFDFLRFLWIEDNIQSSIVNHPFHFFILFITCISLSFISVHIFNKVYKKYGIVGY